MEPTPKEIGDQLDRILLSQEFSTSERLADFLRFIVEETLTGRAIEINQRTVGVKGLGYPSNFDPQTMWRGPVWVNINYFFIEALRQIGEFDLANQLRDKTLSLIMNHNSIYEYYNALTGEPPDMAADIFGWTAAVFIDLAIQANRDVPSGLEPKL